MKVALGLLAFGTFTTWLLAGPFSELLRQTLPYHALPGITTVEMIQEVVAAPATYVALAAVALGAACWWQRRRLAGITRQLQGFARMATDSFGFEAINRGIVRVTQGTAEALRVTQTGLLNWNVAGIAIGLIVVLIVVAWGR